MGTPSQDTDAIILRLVDYKERHRILTLFTHENGKCSVMARNSRGSSKRFGGKLDLFYRGTAHMSVSQGRQKLESLSNFEVRESFENIRTDIVRFAIANFFAELVLSTTAEHDRSEELYSILADTFDRLNRGTESRRLDLIIGFQLRWFEATGTLPELYESAIASAGLPHLEERPLAIARALHSGMDIPELDPTNFQAIGLLTRSLRHQSTGKEMTSVRFLMDVLR